MWTTAKIRRHIAGLARGELFATRDCLNFGSRAAVDRALSRMVMHGYIVRLAWGVFVKYHPDNPPISLEEIARFKAKVFGRRIGTAMAQAAQLLAPRRPTAASHVFATDGSSTSFKFGESTIVLKRHSPRKLNLSQNKAGLFVQALWHEGEWALSAASVARLGFTLGRSDRYQLRHTCAWMPSWLSDFLNHPPEIPRGGFVPALP